MTDTPAKPASADDLGTMIESLQRNLISVLASRDLAVKRITDLERQLAEREAEVVSIQDRGNATIDKLDAEVAALQESLSEHQRVNEELRKLLSRRVPDGLASMERSGKSLEDSP